MNSKYIYASTVAYTLHQKLPTETQRELLLSSRTEEEFFRGLQDTFIAPYLSPGDEENLTHVLDRVVQDAKKELERITPEPKILEILWLKYDFQNLKTLITWKNLGLNKAELEKNWVHLGSHSLDELLKAFEEGKLVDINQRLSQAMEESDGQKDELLKDLILDANYMRSIRDMAQNTKNKFIEEFIQIRIDLFNLLSRLRILTNFSNKNLAEGFFIHGGNYSREDMKTEEKILRTLVHFGGKNLWTEALNEYSNERRLSGIHKAADEYILSWLKKQSIELYSPAPLVAYFIAVKNSVQTIRAIAVSKKLGLSEQKIRALVRKPHQYYAF